MTKLTAIPSQSPAVTALPKGESSLPAIEGTDIRNGAYQY